MHNNVDKRIIQTVVDRLTDVVSDFEQHLSAISRPERFVSGLCYYFIWRFNTDTFVFKWLMQYKPAETYNSNYWFCPSGYILTEDYMERLKILRQALHDYTQLLEEKGNE